MSSPTTGIFRKFTVESVAQLASTKASEQRRIRAQLAEQYPMLADVWEDIMPKKNDIMLVRCHEHVNLVTTTGQVVQVLFFQQFDGPFLPHLKLLHKYPFMLPHHQIDIGGCKYIIGGANVMCQGLTSKGGKLAAKLPAGAPVAIHVEGKQHAAAVGITTMSADQIVKVNRGPCIDNMHCLGDGLWYYDDLARPVTYRPPGAAAAPAAPAAAAPQ